MSSDPNNQDSDRPESIVGQLLQARTEGEQSETRSTKVIVDKDGNKVIKVRKRKRVYSEPEPEKEQKSFKRLFITFAISLILLVLVCAGVFVFRVSSFNSDTYLKAKEEELSRLWGANVRLQSLKVEGMTFHLGRLTAEFPESSIIRTVEINSIKGDLKLSSFVTGVFSCGQINTASSKVVLRNNVTTLEVPRAQGAAPWKCTRMYTDDFQVEFENPREGPFVLKSQLYMRKLEDERHVLELKGKVEIKGWKTIDINLGAPCVYILNEGIDMSIHGIMDENSQVVLTGEIYNGKPLYNTSLKLVGDGISLDYLTNGVFKNVLQAQLGTKPDIGGTEVQFGFTLPTPDMTLPPFAAKVEKVGNIILSRLPVLHELSSVLASSLYTKPAIQEGSMNIVSDGREVKLANINFVESNFFKIAGALNANASQELSGTLRLGVPLMMATRVKLDPDPLFTENDGETAWLAVQVSGTSDAPADNTAELVTRANELRAKQSNPSLLTPDVSERILRDAAEPLPAGGSSRPESDGADRPATQNGFDDLLR